MTVAPNLPDPTRRWPCYDSDDNTECVVSHGMVPYLATQRLKHHEELPPEPRGRIPKSLNTIAHTEAASGPYAANQERACHRQETKGTSRAALSFGQPTRRSDQTSRWLPTIRDARTPPEEGRMATRLPDAQPAETLARRPGLIGPAARPIPQRTRRNASQNSQCRITRTGSTLFGTRVAGGVIL